MGSLEAIMADIVPFVAELMSSDDDFSLIYEITKTSKKYMHIIKHQCC